MNMIDRALELALKVHGGMLDKKGLPVILHPLAVANAVNSIDEKIVALLHDVVEDSLDISLSTLHAFFPLHIVEAVDAITRREGESYTDYIVRVSKNKLATIVKLADLGVNLARCVEGDESLKARYEKAIIQLNELTKNELVVGKSYYLPTNEFTKSSLHGKRVEYVGFVNEFHVAKLLDKPKGGKIRQGDEISLVSIDDLIEVEGD